MPTNNNEPSFVIGKYENLMKWVKGVDADLGFGTDLEPKRYVSKCHKQWI